MEDEPRVFRQPLPQFHMAVGPVVIQDEVEFFLRRELFIQASKEAEKFLMTMALIAFGWSARHRISTPSALCCVLVTVRVKFRLAPDIGRRIAQCR